MTDGCELELLELNQRLLDAIVAGDWDTYAELCDTSITAFEPEACGHLVAGLDFHRFYFDGERGEARRNATMSSPSVRLCGDLAVIAYVRLTQRQEPGGDPITAVSEETRVWQRLDGCWRHVHFHRSTSV